MKKVFVSFSRQDEGLRRRFRLGMAAYSESIEVWDDRETPAGDMWKPAIEKVLSQADAVVLLLTPNLLASSFVRSVEIPGPRRIPVVVIACSWEKVLGDRQVLPRDKVAIQSAPDPDAAWKECIDEVAGLLEISAPKTKGGELLAKHGPGPTWRERWARMVAVALGAIVMVGLAWPREIAPLLRDGTYLPVEAGAEHVAPGTVIRSGKAIMGPGHEPCVPDADVDVWPVAWRPGFYRWGGATRWAWSARRRTLAGITVTGCKELLVASGSSAVATTFELRAEGRWWVVGYRPAEETWSPPR